MSRRPLSTHGITEGALLAALVAVFAVAAHYVPVLGAASLFMVPLPLAVLVIRLGLRAAFLATAVAGIIAAAITGPLIGIGILLTFAPFGIVVGLGVRKGRSAAAILATAALVGVASLVVDLALTLALSGVNPYQITIEAMQRSQETSMDFYRHLGLAPARLEGLESYNRQMRQFLNLMPLFIPVLLLMAGTVLAWVNYQVGRPILRRLGYLLPALPPLSTWRIPPYGLWLLPLAYVFVLVGPRGGTTLVDPLRSVPSLREIGIPLAIGLNLLVATQVGFAFQGVLVAWVLLKRYVVMKMIRVFILVLIIFNPLLGYLAMLLGMAESVFLIRERVAPSAPAEDL